MNSSRPSSGASGIPSAAGSTLESVRQLNRPVTVTGQVVTGDQTGSTIGFPTANLDSLPPAGSVEPGVYFGTASFVLPASSAAAMDQPVVTGTTQINQGDQKKQVDQPAGDKQYACLPYFGPRLVFGELHHNFEVYLFEFGGDIYGYRLTVTLTHFLRPPRHVESLDELKTLLEQDKAVGLALAARILAKRKQTGQDPTGPATDDQ